MGFGRSGSIRAKVVVLKTKVSCIRAKWLYCVSTKDLAKWLYLGKSGSKKWLYKVGRNKSGCNRGSIRAKVVVFGQKWYSGKLGQKWLYSDNWLYSGKSGCKIRFGQKWLYSKWLYSAKVVVFGQKWLYSGKSGCIRAKLLYSGKVDVFRQKWLYSGESASTRAKMVVLRQKWLHSGKVAIVQAKVFVLG